MILLKMHNRRCLNNRIIYPFNKYQIPSSDLLHLNFISSLHYIKFICSFYKHILIVTWFIIFPKYPQLIILFNGTREYSSEHIECFIVAFVIHFDSLNEKGSLITSIFYFLGKLLSSIPSFIVLLHQKFDSFPRVPNMLDQTGHNTRTRFKIFMEN